jgi:ABC-2 type transport system ATP-binding protein
VEFDGFADQQQLMRIAGVVSVRHLGDHRWAVAASPDLDVRPALFQFAVDRGMKVLTLQRSARGLEEVFRELTSGAVDQG